MPIPFPPRIKTLAQLLVAADVDKKLWSVASWTANSWENAAKLDGEMVITTLHQVKARLVPNQAELVADITADTIKAMQAHSPTYTAIPAIIKEPNDNGRMLEISVPDLHFGKWAWFGESGDDYDMDTAERLFHWVIEYTLHKAAKEPVSRILFPLGNDLFNADNLSGTTTKGTPQDNHGRLFQHVQRVRQMCVTAVDRMACVAPVDVLMVPGNHDGVVTTLLGEILAAWYRNHKHVSIDADAKSRKYAKFGSVLLGFAHGNQERVDSLPLLMPNEMRHVWGDIVYAEWHLGHEHRKKEMKFLPVNEIGGVRLRYIPSLSATDAWHYGKGYAHGIRAAESYLWNGCHGLEDLIPANVNSRLREILA